MSEAIRAFIAFGLPDPVAAHIRDLQEALKSRRFPVKWLAPGNIHLTLKFFGSIRIPEAQKAAEIMARAVADRPAPVLRAGGIGAFPSPKRARVLWVGLKGETDRLIRFQGELDRLLTEVGFPAETRPFRAHLTLARARGTIDSKALVDAMAELAKTESPPFAADRLVLYKSDLKPSGAIYTPIVKVTLADAAEPTGIP